MDLRPPGGRHDLRRLRNLASRHRRHRGDDLPDLLRLHHSAIYFFGDKAQIPFRIVYCIAIPVGVLTQLDVVWLLADTCNALMAIPNLIAILLLSPVLFKLVKEDESKDSIFKH